MSLLASIFYWVLQAFFFLLIGRFILDLVLSTNPSWRPKGFILVLSEITMTITDLPLSKVRKIIPPIRFGVISIDLAWTILISAVLFLQGIVKAFI